MGVAGGSPVRPVLGQILRRIRIARGWRQMDAAVELLVSSRTIGAWERGEWPMPRDVAEWVLRESAR